MPVPAAYRVLRLVAAVPLCASTRRRPVAAAWLCAPTRRLPVAAEYAYSFATQARLQRVPARCSRLRRLVRRLLRLVEPRAALPRTTTVHRSHRPIGALGLLVTVLRDGESIVAARRALPFGLFHLSIKKSTIHLIRNGQLADPQTPEFAVWAWVRLAFRSGVNGPSGQCPRGYVLGNNGEKYGRKAYFFSRFRRLSFFLAGKWETV